MQGLTEDSALGTVLQSEERLAARISALVLSELVKKSGRPTYPGGYRLKILAAGFEAVLPAQGTGEGASYDDVQSAGSMSLYQVAFRTINPCTFLGMRYNYRPAGGDYAAVNGTATYFPAFTEISYERNPSGVDQEFLKFGASLQYWADPVKFDTSPLYQSILRTSARSSGVAEYYGGPYGGVNFNAWDFMTGLGADGAYDLLLIEWL